ncbi:MAG TPA: aspartate carbamoyltransferase catalytic subunit [Steroidobacteraceae bacterium]|jgi:aspartate carbamoyltransferase catalytic subunit
MSPPLPQLDAAGRLRHLVTLDGLPRSLLEDLLVRAEALAAKPGRNEALRGVTVANLFGEPSTRTRASFELAAMRQGADVVNLDNLLSSRAKGETLLDTAYTLLAMRVDIFVIRDAEPGVQEQVARAVDGHASVISAGEANVSHPTQGLLDALTIRQCKGDFGGLSVAIVGDIARSRVARSAHRALATLGVPDIRIVAPHAMMPDDADFEGSRRFQDLDEGIAGADVVMMLRIQHERAGGGPVDIEAYHRDFGLAAARLARSAPKAIVMHPGPMNRGVEIDPDVADGPQSVIRRQVANGLAVRMAVLERLAAARPVRTA